MAIPQPQASRPHRMVGFLGEGGLPSAKLLIKQRIKPSKTEEKVKEGEITESQGTGKDMKCFCIFFIYLLLLLLCMDIVIST